MSALLIFGAMVVGLLAGSHRSDVREVRAAERATQGTCAIVAPSGVRADVSVHLREGELLRPALHLWGDHQIACIPRTVRPRVDALVRLRQIRAQATWSAIWRECREYYGDACEVKR